MAQTNSSVSIVIPAFNEERLLVACLDSIAAQMVRPHEVIVVDNNSSDRTAQVAQRYSFVTLISEPRQGVVFARNAGFNAVTGKIIARIDADTVLPPDWVATIENYYRDKTKLNDYALTGGTLPYNLRMPRLMSWVQGQIAFRLNRWLLGHYILFGSNMALPTKLWRRVRSELCLRTDIHEDLDLSIHLHRRGYNIEFWAGFLVGAKIRRVRSQRGQLWANLMWWPRTLRIHNNWRWVFGWLGAVLLFVFSFSLPMIEWFARLFGRRPIPEK